MELGGRGTGRGENARVEGTEALGVLAEAQCHRVQQPRHPVPAAAPHTTLELVRRLESPQQVL